MFRLPVRSLRWRLQAWHALILLAVVTAFGTVFFDTTRRARLGEIDAELAGAARVLEGTMRNMPRHLLHGKSPPPPPPDFLGRDGIDEFEFDGGPPKRPPPGKPDEPPWGDRPRPKPPLDERHWDRALAIPGSLLERFADLETPPYFVIWLDDGEILKASIPVAEAVHPQLEFPTAAGKPTTVEIRQRGAIREVGVIGPERSQIIVGRSVEREQAALAQLAWRIALTGLSVFILGLAGGWWLSRRAVRPLAEMSATAEAITAANLSQRLETEHLDDELGGLARILNGMLGRLESAFAQQVRFTADASHELRTPLAVVLTNAELSLSQKRSPAEYQAALEACLRAANRMKSLVDELLLLARVDAGNLELQRSRVDLGQVAEESAALLQPLANDRGVSLSVATETVEVDGDSRRLSQVVTNLLSNAIAYNRPQGTVRVAIATENEDAVLTVADTGIGIAEADCPHLFERFFRVDRSRGRERGGSGLGLAICQSIVAAHGGAIGVTSEEGVGTTFTVRIPRSAPPPRT